MLGLKDYMVEKVREDKGRIIVKVIVEPKEIVCPYCGLSKLYQHGACKPREAVRCWS